MLLVSKILFERQRCQYLQKCTVYILPDVQIPVLKAILQKFSRVSQSVHTEDIQHCIIGNSK